MKSKQGFEMRILMRILILSLILNFVSIGYANGSTIADQKNVDLGIEKGFNFLYKNQLQNGEFPVNMSFSQDMSKNCSVNEFFGNVSVVYDTAVILHTLSIADKLNIASKNGKIKKMENASIIFLLNNKEKHGVWRFYGKNSELPPDTDDTSVAFSALVENKVNMSDESLDYISNFRTSDGIFYDWINSGEWLSPNSPYYTKKWILNEIDPCFNLDVLYAYSLRNRPQDNVVNYTVSIIENKSFENGSSYYPSPYVFTYLVTKVYADGKVKAFRPYLNNIKEYILKTQNPDGGWGNDFNTALATNALINMGYKGKELENAIGHILRTQKNDGSWDMYGFYTQWDNVKPTVYFGSQEITTSYSLEALMKYKGYLKSSGDENCSINRQPVNVSTPKAL